MNVSTTNISSTTEHPLDALLPDPSGRPPLGDEAEFTEILESMVAAQAPRLFAVVQEYGERVEGRIAAWGMAFDDHVEVVGVTGGSRLSLRHSDLVLRAYDWGSHVRARLMWCDPEAG